jgi:hypothetical protein
MSEELTLFEVRNCEGLKYLTWSMFDSSDDIGSGYKFMEREPVLILDKVVDITKSTLNIELGYVTPMLASQLFLASNNSHRVGKAIKIRIVGGKKRMRIVKNLIKLGVVRIKISREFVYFDTDDLKQEELSIV